MPSIKLALSRARHLLKNTQRPTLESELLLAFVLKKDRVFLHTHDNLSQKDQDKFFRLILLRSTDFPLEYITKKVSFYSLNFYITKGVLIPRAETELLVDLAKKEIENALKINATNQNQALQNAQDLKSLSSQTLKLSSQSTQDLINVAEVGVGSGVVSIVLAKMFENLNFIGTDISKKAIATSAKNAKTHKVQNLELKHCEYLDDVNKKIDLLVSNPPYVKLSYALPANVCFEPKRALFAGKDGLKDIKNLLFLQEKLRIKTLICEIGYDQKKPLQDLGVSEFYKDLNGLDRCFIKRLNE